MNRNSLTTAVIAGIAGVAGIANMANAVNLNPDGLGQVLLYPYYTVNAGQQTLLSVVNATNVGKVARVRFLEGYNGRDVLEFNLYLSKYDVWAAAVFSLADSGNSTAGDHAFAGIFTRDNSCTDPALISSGTLAVDPGQGYQQFLNFLYTGSNADTGPTGDDRTREGHVEIILMSDVVPGSDLDVDITHVQPQGVPADCVGADLENATGYAAPTLDPVTGAQTSTADGGLFGTASIVNVAEGTFYSYNADAIDGFSYVSLYTAYGDPQPTLASVNDRGNPQTATARMYVNGEPTSSSFSNSAQGRTIDAVSALFAADQVYNEYVATPDGATGTDWVLMFPTKRFYVDAQPGGAIAGSDSVYAPFQDLYGANAPGQSCITLSFSNPQIYNREEGSNGNVCPFDPCPPPPQALCLETNVVRFNDTSVLGSELPMQCVMPHGEAGILRLDLGSVGQMTPATNGNAFAGLPVTGFAATRFINGSVPLTGGGNALANYGAANHHRATTACKKTGNGGPCS